MHLRPTFLVLRVRLFIAIWRALPMPSRCPGIASLSASRATLNSGAARSLIACGMHSSSRPIVTQVEWRIRKKGVWRWGSRRSTPPLLLPDGAASPTPSIASCLHAADAVRWTARACYGSGCREACDGIVHPLGTSSPEASDASQAVRTTSSAELPEGQVQLPANASCVPSSLSRGWNASLPAGARTSSGIPAFNSERTTCRADVGGCANRPACVLASSLRSLGAEQRSQTRAEETKSQAASAITLLLSAGTIESREPRPLLRVSIPMNA